ncbi:MAG TPA: hypothetical protein PKK12_13560, partial [Candidatus Aminicenantes bacterium]|nr:hypothetical protein [Candidatus Aminicenantes bacterium]
MKRISIFLVAGLAGLLLADETKPGPRPEQPFNRYDLAVIDIDTTGPNGQPKYAPVITIRNTGSAFINRDLAVEYWSNG